MASEDMAARELARQIAGVQKSVRSLSHAAQVARSTINVEGADVPIPDVIQTGVDAAGAVDDLRDNVEGSFGDVEDLLGDMADLNRDELDALNATAAAPTGLAVTVNEASWGPSGMVVTTVTVVWDAVVVDIDGADLITTGYDIESTVAGDAIIDGQTDLETFTTTLWAPGVERTVRVRARVGFTLGEWSDPITVTPAIPAHVTTPPTPPTLTTGGGGVFIAWDGLLTTGPVPGGFQGVFAEYRIGTTGAFLRAVGPLSSGPGQVGQARAAIGDVVQARLRWVDTLGRVSNISDQRQITVAGVAVIDLEQELADAIDQAQSDAANAQTVASAAQSAAGTAQTTANEANAAALAAAGLAGSKGEVIYQASAPTGSRASSANLWIRTSDNRPHTYNGTTWVAVTDKVATDAATAAATAQSKADQAFDNATAAATAAGNAQTTADGKNRVWYQTTAPTGSGHKLGDVWFDTDDDNKPSYWSGTAWQEVPFGTNAIADAAITNAKILDATIQNAKIANLDAAKITSGYLDVANRIQAGSLAIGKVNGLQGALDTKVPTVSTAAGTAAKTFRNVLNWSNSSNAQAGFLVIQTPITFSSYMTSLRIRGFNYRSSESVIDIALSGYIYSVGPNVINSTVTVQGTADIASVRWARNTITGTAAIVLERGGDGLWYYPKLSVDEVIIGHSNPPDSFKDGWSASYVTDLSAYSLWTPVGVDYSENFKVTKAWRTTGTTLIDGGKITTDSVTAAAVLMNQGFADKFWGNEGNFGKISVDYVTPNFGSELDISASESVNILVGNVSDLQAQISDQGATIDDQAAQIAANEAAAAQAGQGASSAQIAAAAAAAAAAVAQADVDRLGAVFAFEADGLGISAPGSPVSMKLGNDSASIRRNGVAKTIWTEDQMIVPKLQAAQVIVGQTVITEKPGGMTWQRL